MLNARRHCFEIVALHDERNRYRDVRCVFESFVGAAARIIKSEGDAIERLATALDQRGKLDGDDVAEILAWRIV